MKDKTTITQNSSIGSNTTQIGIQNNSYGLTPEATSKLAIDLFMENFPKLQEEANKIVRTRVDELVKEIISEIEKKYNSNYSAFSNPDMQYILVQAEKGYARRGTKELCTLLSSLIADRSTCLENSYLEIILDNAIKLAPSLLPSHLDYISLIFLYKYTIFNNISTIEDIKEYFTEIHNLFQTTTSTEIVPYLNMLGILILDLKNIEQAVANAYSFNKQEISKVLPPEHKKITGDYGLTPVGIALAIFNIRAKSNWNIDITTFIHE